MDNEQPFSLFRYQAETDGLAEQLSQETRESLARLMQTAESIKETVAEMTSCAVPLLWGGSTELRRKIVVVIGKTPITDSTHDYTTVCGVTFVEDLHEKSHLNDTAEFAFAKVPTRQLQHFLDEPHDLQNPDLADVKQVSNKKTLSDYEILVAAEEITRSRKLMRQFVVDRLETRSVRDKAKMAIINQAYSDQALNAHLYAGDSKFVQL